jgi:hypothetical protein
MIVAKNQQKQNERLGITNDEIGINKQMVSSMFHTKVASPAHRSPFLTNQPSYELIPILSRR